ncbi:MAG: type II secretion system protein [Vitreoscilla sp.]|nr:type II secretion system protein [Vitreoscilla sp.]
MSAPLQTRAMPAHRALGFTMIELIVVMAVIGLLLSLAAPRYLASLERGKDQVVEHDLAQMRKAIDQFYGDRGAYPERLDELVTFRYLRNLPVNPHTDAVDWITVPPPGGRKGNVYDVRAVDKPSPDLPTEAPPEEENGAAAPPDANPPAPNPGEPAQ